MLGVELAGVLDDAIYTGVDYVVLLFPRGAAAAAQLEQKGLS